VEKLTILLGLIQ